MSRNPGSSASRASWPTFRRMSCGAWAPNSGAAASNRIQRQMDVTCISTRAAPLAAIALAAALPLAAVQAAADSHSAAFVPESRVLPDKLLLLGSARAGKRLVVVGERGRILYTDDDGKAWQVADSPVLTTLTAIAFSDDKNGIAVGHRGTLLVTRDGGSTWQDIKLETKDQNALLSVWVRGADAIAVGAYGTYLESHDTGRTWKQR